MSKRPPHLRLVGGGSGRLPSQRRAVATPTPRARLDGLLKDVTVLAHETTDPMHGPTYQEIATRLAAALSEMDGGGRAA